ncbi:MAG: hypothetical protein NkDv07_0284 [Candidatus Improbicoccus devescovinae]|nr:MAG: hypothetical protein NkDv07_0284 [Candidatus Improbicoccus devescovinae]
MRNKIISQKLLAIILLVGVFFCQGCTRIAASGGPASSLFLLEADPVAAANNGLVITNSAYRQVDSSPVLYLGQLNDNMFRWCQHLWSYQSSAAPGIPIIWRRPIPGAEGRVSHQVGTVYASQGAAPRVMIEFVTNSFARSAPPPGLLCYVWYFRDGVVLRSVSSEDPAMPDNSFYPVFVLSPAPVSGVGRGAAG